MLHHQINSCNNSPACHSLCAAGNKSLHHSIAYFTPCWIHFRCLTRDEYTGCIRTYLALRPDIWLAAQLNADPANCCIISHFQYPRIQSQVDDNTSKTISFLQIVLLRESKQQSSWYFSSTRRSEIGASLVQSNLACRLARVLALCHSLRVALLVHRDLLGHACCLL